jgi:hypothetical protein
LFTSRAADARECSKTVVRRNANLPRILKIVISVPHCDTQLLQILAFNPGKQICELNLRAGMGGSLN